MAKKNNVVQLQAQAVKPKELSDAEQLKLDIEDKIKLRDDGMKYAKEHLIADIRATVEAFGTAEGVRSALTHDQLRRLSFDDARVIAKHLVEMTKELLDYVENELDDPEDYTTIIDKYCDQEFIYKGTVDYNDYVTQLIVIDVLGRQIGNKAAQIYESWQRSCEEIKELEAKMFDLQFPEQAKKE